jgi:hypothetical protein
VHRGRLGARRRAPEEVTVMTLEELHRLDEIEDFFAFFDLVPEPHVIAHHRVAVLRVWAREIAEIEQRAPLPPERERLALYREALRRAHDAFAADAAGARLRFGVLPGGRSSSASCAGCACPVKPAGKPIGATP